MSSRHDIPEIGIGIAFCDAKWISVGTDWRIDQIHRVQCFYSTKCTIWSNRTKHSSTAGDTSWPHWKSTLLQHSSGGFEPLTSVSAWLLTPSAHSLVVSGTSHSQWSSLQSHLQGKLFIIMKYKFGDKPWLRFLDPHHQDSIWFCKADFARWLRQIYCYLEGI